MFGKNFIKNWTKGEYAISTDDSKLQIKVIHEYLSKDSYWSKEITEERVQTSINNSLCFGLYYQDKQIGFARCITDFATYGYLCDVFIIPEYQKNGLGKWLLETIFSVDTFKFKRWMLTTLDAHGLYKKAGFTPLEKPEVYMHKYNPSFYKEAKESDNNHNKTVGILTVYLNNDSTSSEEKTTPEHNVQLSNKNGDFLENRLRARL